MIKTFAYRLKVMHFRHCRWSISWWIFWLFKSLTHID